MLAILLPCFWVYREVGRHIHATLSGSDRHLCRRGIRATGRRDDRTDQLSRRNGLRIEARGDTPSLPSRDPAGVDVMGERQAPKHVDDPVIGRLDTL